MPPTPNERMELRKKRYKMGVDVEAGRKRRRDSWVQMRKTQREDKFLKERSFGLNFLQKGLESIPFMLRRIWSNDTSLQLEATTQFRLLLSIGANPPIDEVIRAEVVQLFVQFLGRHDVPQLQLEAAWALSNIASGTPEHTRVVIEHGAVPMFVGLFRSTRADVKEQAVRALGILVTGNNSQIQFLIDNEVLPHLCCVLRCSTNNNVVKSACSIIVHITAGNRDQIQAVMGAHIIVALVYLFQRVEFDIKKKAVLAICNALSGGSIEQIRSMAKSRMLYGTL